MRVGPRNSRWTLLCCSVVQLTALALFVAAFLMGCDAKGKAYLKHPGHQVITQLESRRIVMLGDFLHDNALSFYTVTAVLNDWLNMFSSGQKVPRHLTLVLEEDDSMVHVLKNYMSSGDREPLLDFWLPYGTLESLEFFGDLRSICARVDSINQTLSKQHRIVFDIFGGEPFSLVSNRNYLRLSREESWRFFVQKRDSLVALRIESYLRQNPLQRALIFYGNAHLINGYVTKRIQGESSDTANSKGYYLAHYLKEFFGQQNVLSINQMDISPNLFRGTDLEAAGDSDIFTYSRGIPLEVPYLKDYDAVIIRHEAIVPSHPVDLIFSRRIIERCILNIDTMQAYFPGYDARFYANQSLNALKIITGESFSQPQQWERWYNTQKFDGLSRLESKGFARQIFDQYYERNFNYQTAIELYYLSSGIPIFYPNPRSRVDTSIWRIRWKDIRFNMECGNAIGIYWIGYSQERKEAHQWLVDHTGKDFSTPAQYLKWWRHVVFNANY